MKKLIDKIIIIFCMALMVGVLGSGYVKADELSDKYVNAVPKMTSNTSPSGIASSDNNYNALEAYKAFDKINHYYDTSYYAWGTNNTTGKLSYEFPEKKVISAYALDYDETLPGAYIPSLGVRPKEWTFEGWDGEKWVILDERTVLDWKNKDRRVFEINNTNAYKKYQLNIKSNSGDTQYQVNLYVDELELLENANTSQPSQGTILNIEPEKSKIKLNETVSANLTIDNIKDIAAEDVRIKYDNTKLQFLGSTEVDGIKLVKNEQKDGELRFIVASKGVTNVVQAKKVLLKLNFKGIAAGDALVDVTKGRVSDGITMEKDLTDDQCGQATITIDNEALVDVNKDGQFTLLDLAIDGRHYSEDPASLPQYNTDIVVNKAIDDDDLTKIGEYMLANPNYKF